MSDRTRLVEQAREALRCEWVTQASEDEARGVLAGLADAVEQLQRERDEWAAANVRLVFEDERARARVAELEAEKERLRDGLDVLADPVFALAVSPGSKDAVEWFVGRIRALLDGGEDRTDG